MQTVADRTCRQRGGCNRRDIGQQQRNIAILTHVGFEKAVNLKETQGHVSVKEGLGLVEPRYLCSAVFRSHTLWLSVNRK